MYLTTLTSWCACDLVLGINWQDTSQERGSVKGGRKERVERLDMRSTTDCKFVVVQSISSWLSKNCDENPRMRALGWEFE